VIIYHSIH